MKNLLKSHFMFKTKIKDTEVNGIVHALRKKNFKIRIQHHRFVDNSENPLENVPELNKHYKPNFLELGLVTKKNKHTFRSIAGFGGKTKIDLTTPDGRTFTEISNCAIEDGYNKKLGVRIALGRALKKAGCNELNLVNCR